MDEITGAEMLEQFLAKRGIPADLSKARGYTSWEPETGSVVIAESFEGLHRGGVQWLQKVASEQPGFAIVRMPVPFPGAEEVQQDGVGYGGRILPEIKTMDVVKVGSTRHYHGAPKESFTEFLPSRVTSAVCVPKLGFSKLYFTHDHEEGADSSHHATWHSGAAPGDEHRHCLMLFKPYNMRDHVANEGGKFSNPHVGENTNEVHTHIKGAKYLFPPNPSVPTTWDGEHTHEHLNDEKLAKHLTLKEHE